MKNLGLFDKFIFVFNSLAATALLLSYLLAYIPPKTFPLLSVLSLGVPVLILINVLFLIYWAIRLKRQVLLSAIVLLLGYTYVSRLYQFAGDEDPVAEDDFLVMSYNVRMFNAYNWKDDKEIPEKITRFIKEKAPDILCLQEYYIGATGLSEIYPYSYIKLKRKNDEFGSAIFSKFPIINKKSVDFPQQGNNNAIYADLVMDEDTIRVFNVHLQSLNVKPEIHELQKEDSEKLLARIGSGFAKQQDQAELMLAELRHTPHKTIVAGDFNNTNFSYVYQKVKNENDFKDSFLEAGSGFGQTFKLNYFPLRIDFLLVEEDIEVQSYERFRVDHSDHFPIMARLRF